MAQVTAGFHERFARCCSLLHFTARRILGCSAQAELAIRNCWLSASRNPPLFSHDWRIPKLAASTYDRRGFDHSPFPPEAATRSERLIQRL